MLSKTFIKISNLASLSIIHNQTIFLVTLAYDKVKTCHLFLFSLFINDVESQLYKAGAEGAKIEYIDNEISFMLQVLLLYADDTVLFGHDPRSMQKSLDTFNEYCKCWKLDINISKTKVVIFGGGPINKIKTRFKLGDREISVQDSYTYLGIPVHRNRKFNFAIKQLTHNASKAMFCLLRRAKNNHLPLDTLFKAFDVMIAPILLYGCEIWGYENIETIEKLHLKFLKISTGLRNSTANFFIYGELGREPMNIKIAKRTIMFWHNTLSSNTSKISKTILDHLMYNKIKNDKDNVWLRNVEDILNRCGLSDVFRNPHNYSTKWVGSRVETTLRDHFYQSWRSSVINSSKGINYKLIKEIPSFEQYLLLDKSLHPPLLKLRTSNHNFPVETGRWRGLSREDRTCPLCNSPSTADEIHYIFRCSTFDTDRRLYINESYCKWPNMYKYKSLICTRKMSELKNLVKYLKIVYKKLK